eukprot:scaffold58977_cov62-Phaeocystis_antarctica.AAC.2
MLSCSGATSTPTLCARRLSCLAEKTSGRLVAAPTVRHRAVRMACSSSSWSRSRAIGAAVHLCYGTDAAALDRRQYAWTRPNTPLSRVGRLVRFDWKLAQGG